MTMSFQPMSTPTPPMPRGEGQDSHLAYPMQAVAASIYGRAPVRPLRHVMLCGVTRKVGTSFVARSLANSLSYAAKRVLIIEVASEPCKSGELPRLLDDPTLPSPDRPMTVRIGRSEFMSLIAFGPESFDEVSRRLAERFDLLVWDMPPPGPATPTATAVRLMDGAVLVVAMGRTERRAAAYVADTLRESGGHLLGVVVNRVRGKQRK